MSFYAECDHCDANTSGSSTHVWSWARAHEDDGCPKPHDSGHQ